MVTETNFTVNCKIFSGYIRINCCQSVQYSGKNKTENIKIQKST